MGYSRGMKVLPILLVLLLCSCANKKIDTNGTFAELNASVTGASQKTTKIKSNSTSMRKSLSEAAGATAFVVCINDSWASGDRILSQNDGVQLDYGTTGGSLPMNRDINTGFSTLKLGVGAAANVTNVTNSVPHLLAHRRNDTAVTNLAYRSGWSNSATGTTNAVTASFKKFGLGTCGDVAWAGRVAEVIYFDSYLSDTQYNQVRDMLLTKYALS